MDVSKEATDFIDLTILNTPCPQATSTIQRKSVHSYRSAETKANYRDFEINLNNEMDDADVPTRDTDVPSNLSHQSLTSSLGILSLGNVEDINEYLQTNKLNRETQKAQRISNINETLAKLAKERLLAQRIIDKCDLESKKRNSGLPTYLLKPSQTGINSTVNTATPVKNESTINLSDLERSLSRKTSNASEAVNFEANEISARSSSLSNRTNMSLGTHRDEFRSPSPVCGMSSDFAAKFQNIYEQMRQSDVSVAAICNRSSQMGMQTQPLGSLPLPEIDTIDLSSTCASWTNIQQDSLVAKLQNELFTPAELAEEKLLADELSWHKARDIVPPQSYNNKADISCFSGFIGDTSMRSKENDGVSISEYFKRRTEDVEDLNLKSSPKKIEPVPLIDTTNEMNDDEPEVITKQKDSPMPRDSILTMSQIANVISNMETPTRAVNLLLKHSSQNNQKSSTTISNTDLSDNTTLKNSRVATTLFPASGTNSTLKENCSAHKSSTNPPRKFSTEVLRDTTNLPDTQYDEWTDVKPNIMRITDNNENISSTAESPSYSCSELEFSNDDKTSLVSYKFSDDFIQIDSTCNTCKLYVNVTQNVPINLTSKTNHWLQVKLSRHIISSGSNDKNIAEVDIINENGMLEPYRSGQFLLKITSLVPGEFKIQIKIYVMNTITRQQQIVDHTLTIKSEDPKIEALSDILDFELIPEGTVKKHMLPIRNESTTSVLICLTIEQKHEGVYIFGTDPESDFDKDNKIDINRKITLPAHSTITVPVEMRGFPLEDLGVCQGEDCTTVHGTLRMHFGNKPKTLQEINLTGRVGYTNVQFKKSCMPFVLLPGQTKPLLMRNAGAVPLELSVKITSDTEDSSKIVENNTFTVDRTNLVLKPGQEGTVNVTFNPKDKFQSVKRLFALSYPRGPNFVLPIEGIVDTRSPDVWSRKSPRVDRPGSGSSGTSHSSLTSLHTLPDGKLPIESTRTELVWGCVRPGRTNTQDFVLRNRCSQRLRLQAVIQGSHAFKFMKEYGDNTCTNLVLHSLESRTISVSFCPSSKGSATARLTFLPVEQNSLSTKRQMIQLYGYGGHISVDVQKVAKDTSGRMWLSFGRLDYQATLHQTFILRNTGSLAAFAYLNVTCKALYPFMDSSVIISPTEAVIEANNEIEISVHFNPRPEDFKYIQNATAVEVSEIASIKIMTGPEPTRGRIRRIFNKLKSNNTDNRLSSQFTSAFIVPRLSAEFPDENIPSDVSACRESSGALRELLRDVDTRELILTVERSGPDYTVVGDALDNTLMFQSLAVAENTTLNTTGCVTGGYCSVEPKRITLHPTERGIVLVRSYYSRPMPFEVSVPNVAAEAGLQVSPLSGILSPGNVEQVNICYTSRSVHLPHTCTLLIYVENEVMEVELNLQNNKIHRP